METKSATEFSKDLKNLIRPQICSLTRLLTALKEEPAEEVLGTLNNLDSVSDRLSEVIPDFARRCLEDVNKGGELIKDMDKDLSSWLWLSRKFAEEPDFSRIHPAIPPYLYKVKIKIRPVRKKLRKETGYYESARHSGNTNSSGNFAFNSSSVNFVQYNGPVLAASTEGLFPTAPFVDPSEQSLGTDLREKHPAEEKTAVSEPPQEFCLPDFLEMLPIKPEKKERFRRILWFLTSNPLPFKLKMYGLLLGEFHLVLEEFCENKKELDETLTRLCDPSLKNYREASGYRCKYQNPDTGPKDRYTLIGEYPEFEMQLRTLL